MTPSFKQSLREKLLAMADDELILAHRDSEWTGHAPILEEDIAFSNIAQDELGHAGIWYGLIQTLTQEEPDKLAFFREPADFFNVQLVELPKGDWAVSMVRQYLFDAYEMVLLSHLLNSQYAPLAEAAVKQRNEEIYHYRHTTTWLKRLGLGTAESHRRTQQALDSLWPYAWQLFVPLPGEALLVAQGVVPDSAVLQSAWEEVVRPFLQSCSLIVPQTTPPAAYHRSDHTPYLADLLREMQEVARLDAEAVW